MNYDIFVAAAIGSELPKLKEMIRLGTDIEACDIYGKTLLQIACRSNNVPAVEFLVEKNAFIGENVLNQTIKNGRCKILEILLEKKSHTFHTYKNKKDLLKAAIFGENDKSITKKMVRILMKYGVDINQVIGGIQRTSLHKALDLVSKKSTETLLEVGANINIQDDEGRNLLLHAKHQSQEALSNYMQALVKTGRFEEQLDCASTEEIIEIYSFVQDRPIISVEDQEIQDTLTQYANPGLK